jgi:predicted phosphoribosyltransferase
VNGFARYQDRRKAGRVLAQHVLDTIHPARAIVVALPRGGVPVGDEIASALGAPLDVFVVRKLGLPGQPEIAMGAVAQGGFEVLNQALIDRLGISQLQIAAVADCEAAELARRERLYRPGRAPLDVVGQTVIVVDDGIATGFTLRAAIAVLRQGGPAHLVIAAPVGAKETCAEIAGEVDLLICPLQPEPFGAVGYWYVDFTPTTDDEVCKILARRNWSSRQGSAVNSRFRI